MKEQEMLPTAEGNKEPPNAIEEKGRRHSPDAKRGPNPRKWDGRSRGTFFGYRIYGWVLRTLGLRFSYIALYGVALYFFLFGPKAVHASGEYLERRLGPMPWWKRFGRVYHHLVCFGQVVLDRGAFSLGVTDKLEFTSEGLDELRALMTKEHGAVLLSAHIGNWAVAGRMLSERSRKEGGGKRIYVMMLADEAEQLQKYMESIHQTPSFEVIPVQHGMNAILKAIGVLEEGHIVCLHGDRSLEGGRAIRGRFLGGETMFPALPYYLAASVDVPMFRVYGVKRSWWNYHLISNGPHYCQREKGESKKAAQKRWLDSYLRDMEDILERYPYQWFNFYPFWEQEIENSPQEKRGVSISASPPK